VPWLWGKAALMGARLGESVLILFDQTLPVIPVMEVNTKPEVPHNAALLYVAATQKSSGLPVS
jgi:hypothetical protein